MTPHQRELARHALDEVERLRAERDSTLAEVERLRGGIAAFLDGDPGVRMRSSFYGSDGQTRYDCCRHRRPIEGDCDECTRAYFRRILNR